MKIYIKNTNNVIIVIIEYRIIKLIDCNVIFDSHFHFYKNLDKNNR